MVVSSLTYCKKNLSSHHHGHLVLVVVVILSSWSSHNIKHSVKMIFPLFVCHLVLVVILSSLSLWSSCHPSQLIVVILLLSWLSHNITKCKNSLLSCLVLSWYISVNNYHYGCLILRVISSSWSSHPCGCVLLVILSLSSLILVVLLLW